MENTLSIASCFLTNSWNFINSVQFPGLGVSLGTFFISIFLMGLGFRILAYVLGFSLPLPGEAPKHDDPSAPPVNWPNAGRLGDGGSDSIARR